MIDLLGRLSQKLAPNGSRSFSEAQLVVARGQLIPYTQETAQFFFVMPDKTFLSNVLL